MTNDKTNHTPGPWNLGAALNSTHATPIRWNGENLAWVCGLDSAHQFTKAQTQANARLIAAAPDLLDALERILRAHDSNNNGAVMGEAVLCRMFAEKARAAIAKAEGQP